MTGTYQWNATYNGDANNSPDSDIGDCSERVTVSPASPAITTTPSTTCVTLSSTAVTVKDTATLSGGYYETGSIVFTLVAPGGSTVDTETVSVSGNGSYTTPTGYTLPTTVTGTYQWNASYNGDTNNKAVADNGDCNERVVVNCSPITVSGTKFNDLTGNGFSSDDAGQSGVTINLYMESNCSSGLQTGCGGDKLVATTTTASNGTYSFSNLVPGTYYVQEAVPAGYVQTGGGPNGSAGSTYYTICAQKGQIYGGNNFDDYLARACGPGSVSFKVTSGSTSKTVTGLSGNTQQGNTVQVTFTVPSGMNEQLTLVSYVAPGSTYNASTAHQQQIFDAASGTFAPGTYTLTVQIPNCYYQIDFVCGLAINQLVPPLFNGSAYGPDNSNITYSAQGRLISADNGGTQVCVTPSVKAGDFATVKFWSDSYGRGVLDKLNGGGTSGTATSLGKWLASNFPHLYGPQADAGNPYEKNLAGVTNATVASFFTTLYGATGTNLTYAQIMATALASYATDTVLAGGTCAASYLNTSSNGTGLDSYSVGTGGSLLGLTGSPTVLTILDTADQQAFSTNNFNTILSTINPIFSGINSSGGVNNGTLAVAVKPAAVVKPAATVKPAAAVKPAAVVKPAAAVKTTLSSIEPAVLQDVATALQPSRSSATKKQAAGVDQVMALLMRVCAQLSWPRSKIMNVGEDAEGHRLFRPLECRRWTARLNRLEDGRG